MIKNTDKEKEEEEKIPEDFRVIPVMRVPKNEETMEMKRMDVDDDDDDDELSKKIQRAALEYSQIIKLRRQKEKEEMEKVMREKKHENKNYHINNIYKEIDIYVMHLLSIIFLTILFLIAGYHHYTFRAIYIIFLLLIFFIPEYTDNFINCTIKTIVKSYLFVRNNGNNLIGRK